MPLAQLPEQCQALWEAYVATERVRIRDESNAALARFADALLAQEDEVWKSWARSLAGAVVDGGDQTVVRFPLFRRIIFPTLRAGVISGEPGCARWLAGFAQLLYQSPECAAQLPDDARTEYGLLLGAIRAEPDDRRSKERMCHMLRGRFDYTLHELPAGVLYSRDGATIDECTEMLAELDFYESLVGELGPSERDHELIAETRFYIPAYREYLRAPSSATNFEAFLETRTRKK